MSLLRHPVVITSIEEDLNKIGLIQESAAPEVVEEEYEGEDYGIVEDSEVFHENFVMEWERLGEEGAETVHLTDAQMAELESFASDVEEAVVVASESSEDEAIEAFEGVSQLQEIYERLEEGTHEVEAHLAIPAFANLALVAEQLHTFYDTCALTEGDADFAEIADHFREMALYSAQVVDALQEDAHTIDTERLSEMFQEYLSTVLEGLDTFTILQEAKKSSDCAEEEMDDAESDDAESDDDEYSDYDEDLDEEGNE